MKSTHRSVNDKAISDIPPATLWSLYATMLKIRCIEERVAELLCPTPEIVCPVHLYIGQEAVAPGLYQGGN
ncbi:MAG: hypothetical protein PHI12_09235 [Dehalococcoidales bacterium]|nr:hypothetical protein [Dehalococcoidales bacterium]